MPRFNLEYVCDFLGIGIAEPVGDVDVYLDIKSKTFLDKIKFESHDLALYMHFGTSTKKFFLIGEIGGKGKIVKNSGQKFKLKLNEYLIGVYGTLAGKRKGKRFDISLLRNEDAKFFWDSISEFR